MAFTARIQQRDFGEFVALPDLALRPLRWAWRAQGGPDFAEIGVDGDEEMLWQMLAWLRCPITIYSDGVPVWWGYVADAAFSSSALAVAVSLEDMYNKLAVAYSLVEAGSQTVGERATTAWVSDTTSTGEYGTKELLGSIDGATSTTAEAVRDVLLTQHRYPRAIPQASGQYGSGGRLICLGWYSTLGWRYYANSATASTVTTTQIGAIVTGVGEFLSADIVDASGVSSSEYRNGDNTALVEIEEMLRTPTSGGARLAATVTVDRRLQVALEGDSGDDDWLVTPGGLRDRWGSLPLAGSGVLGWAQLRGIVPASANLNYMGAPSPLYIEANEFDAGTLAYRWQARGMASPWELSRIAQG